MRFVIDHEADLASAGLGIERRAALVMSAHMIVHALEVGDWDTVATNRAQIATVLDAYLVGTPAPTDPPSGAASYPRSAIVTQLRRLWERRNTEGISLEQAVAVAASGRPDSQGSVDAPAR